MVAPVLPASPISTVLFNLFAWILFLWNHPSQEVAAWHRHLSGQGLFTPSLPSLT